MGRNRYNTRIAPSPTGHFHFGTARTAYFSWLAARASGGKFLLRIDDTDKARSKKEFEDTIFSSMAWLNLDYDFTFNQSSRYDVYKEYLDAMVTDDLIYKDDSGAFKLTNPFTPDYFMDFVGGRIKISDKDKAIVRDMVLFRADGTPTYHFASVADDIDFDINLVLRGKDHISNTPRHLAIADCFRQIGKANDITYGHLGLIMKDGRKLSKRDGSSNLANYMEKYCSEAVLNHLLKLGWSHKDPEIDKKMPLIFQAQAISMFFDGNLRPVNSNFNQNKLDWLNKKYKARKVK